MRWLLSLSLAACSNAADPKTDAQVQPLDAATADAEEVAIDAPAMVRALVINEVAAGEMPDWFEIVNVSTSAIQLADFVYVDVADDFVKAKAFPSTMLQPGAYYVQNVDTAGSGFALGSDEELHVYRASDMALSDTVDWAQGAAAMGTSYARVPDTTGDFVTGAQSKGVANP